MRDKQGKLDESGQTQNKSYDRVNISMIKRQEREAKAQEELKRQQQQKFKPIIVKTKSLTKYEKGVEESEINSQYSKMSDFAFKDSQEMFQEYNRVFGEFADEEDLRIKHRVKRNIDEEIEMLDAFFAQLPKVLPLLCRRSAAALPLLCRLTRSVRPPPTAHRPPRAGRRDAERREQGGAVQGFPGEPDDSVHVRDQPE